MKWILIYLKKHGQRMVNNLNNNPWKLIISLDE